MFFCGVEYLFCVFFVVLLLFVVFLWMYVFVLLGVFFVVCWAFLRLSVCFFSFCGITRVFFLFVRVLSQVRSVV